MNKIKKTKIGYHNDFIVIEFYKKILEEGWMKILLKKIKEKNIS
ncbi:hypothetical protein [Blattabacterium punctulatus]|nr:hypothetical protein [Blattabacterium punctulatus]